MIDEVMSGTHCFIDRAGPLGDHPMSFSITWGTKDFFSYLNPFRPAFLSNFIEGKVNVGNLVEEASCRGSLDFFYFSQGKIRYVFDFMGDNGKAYQYVGEKVNIRPWNLHKSHTTCYGIITELESQKEISHSILKFELSTLPDMLKSFRLGINT